MVAAARPAAIDLSGATFTVGSKEFTEQNVLGQIAVQALEAAGADVKDLTTHHRQHQRPHRPHRPVEIDMYWEYTGTGWTTHLQHEPGSAAKDPARRSSRPSRPRTRRTRSTGWTRRR